MGYFGAVARYLKGAFAVPCHSVLVLTRCSQIFYDATQLFSRKTPSLATVIPVMDRIDEHLATISVDKKYSASIRAAASLGKKTINRYYDLTDGSESYRIAMGK